MTTTVHQLLPGGGRSAPAMTLPALIDRARACLANAQSSAQVLEARVAAKAALHYAKLKDATAEAHADCLRIIALAELRLADEIDAAQERGEVARRTDTLRQGAVPRDAGNGATGFEELPGVTTQRLADWRQLRDAGGEIVVERAIARAIKDGRAPGHADIRREMGGHHRTRFTGENEWYTPAPYVDAARAMLGGIDLDPASSAAAQETIKAARYFTLADDGLQQAWHGRVWLNPPYTQPDIAQFINKLLGELNAGRTVEAILLTHNYTDTAWFHAAAKGCAAICFTRGRIKFINPDGKPAAPAQGQAFFYFGPRLARFRDGFGAFGFIR